MAGKKETLKHNLERLWRQTSYFWIGLELKARNNKAVVRRTRIKEPVSAENYNALVEAKSRAIATLSRAIVDELARVSNRD